MLFVKKILCCLGLMHVMIVLSSTPTSSTTSTADSSLTAIAAAASNVSPLPNDPQSRNQNYLKYHFAPAATRLSNVCNMTTNLFSGNGTPADRGSVIGLENNTNVTFNVMQAGMVIGQVLPGWNGDLILNLAALVGSAASSGSTGVSALPAISLVPMSNSAQSKLLVRVMTGQQLFGYIQSVQTRESSDSGASSSSAATVSSWYKNGQQPIPSAAEISAVGSDWYLVVENESLESSAPLTEAAKRIQVLNLSNIISSTMSAVMYTVSLSINSMGLVLMDNKVNMENGLSSIHAISIKGVHVLDEVQGHTVPLLLMPRAVYLAGSAVNALYGSYIQSYAAKVSNANAGSASVYYDLSIAYSHEPFAYLRLLKYFDLDKTLRAVVDSTATMPSGSVISSPFTHGVGSMMTTDVYGAYAWNVSPDLSWVDCTQSGLDTADNSLLLFTMTDELTKQVQNNGSSASAASSTSITSAPTSTSSFAQSTDSLNVLNWFNGINITVTPSYGNATYALSIISLGSPTDVTANQSYNSKGSFPSALWNLSHQDWFSTGIKMVPVFYNASTRVPFVNTQNFGTVSASTQSALYFYAYRGDGSNQFLGMLPVLNAATGNVNTFPFVTGFIDLYPYNASQNIAYDAYLTGVQSTGYANYDVKTGLDYMNASLQHSQNSGFVQSPYQWGFDYPGYFYWLNSQPNANKANIAATAVLNKCSDVSDIYTWVQDTWTLKNKQNVAWAVSVPQATLNGGVTLQVKSLGANAYQISVIDQQNNVLAFQKIKLDNLVVDKNLVLAAIPAASSVVDIKNGSVVLSLPLTGTSNFALTKNATGLNLVRGLAQQAPKHVAKQASKHVAKQASKHVAKHSPKHVAKRTAKHTGKLFSKGSVEA